LSPPIKPQAALMVMWAGRSDIGHLARVKKRGETIGRDE
jgi:hypothetical protein